LLVEEAEGKAEPRKKIRGWSWAAAASASTFLLYVFKLLVEEEEDY
jgi:hypothetical protein